MNDAALASRSQEIMDEFYSREGEIDHLSAAREIANALAVAEAERDALLGDLRMIAKTTPHWQRCDEPDDPSCARCVADSALARAEVGE